MVDRKKEYKKIERRIFKMECKIESIDDELYHLEIIRVDHKGKLNKKRLYRKEHLQKVRKHYVEEIEDMRLELKNIEKEMKNDD